jgi:ABC-type transport system involved in multi-copper enzyme maturation permease subunit
MRLLVLAVARDLLHEALRRRWFLALGAAITLLLVVLAFSLQLDVVDGALAASRLFGDDIGGAMRPADVALRPLYKATAYLIFYGGLGFGILACADFAPSMLSPGRIEHLLSLPVRRAELVAGTFLGVLAIAAAGAVYGSAGFTLILGLKSGIWTPGPILAALLASVSFTAIYGAMLAAATLVRSASLSAATGGGILVAGIVSSYRADLSGLFNPGVWRGLFEGVTALMPRIATLADLSADLSASIDIDGGALVRLLLGVALFGLAMLSLAAWRMERLDF